jgi:CHASE2 domain-containing sensor protein
VNCYVETISQVTVSLPPIPDLIDCYRDWKAMYQAFQNQLYQKNNWSHRAISIATGGVTHVSKGDFDQLCTTLKQTIDKWFDSDSFRRAKDMMLASLNPQDEIRIMLETEDQFLWRIPWHQWRFFEQYPLAELTLTGLSSRSLTLKKANSSSNVQVLAILGDAGGIDLEPDIQAIRALPHVSIEFLTQPSRQDLNQALWKQNWDILFFAGHSSSADQPQIMLSSTTSLTIAELSHALNQAVDCGLQLAIFNSCDGVGLVKNFSELNLPHGVVMREDVPDRIAQIFLRNFLEFFADGLSLSSAIRQARLKLQGHQDQYPQASWLPALYSHPQASTLYWTDFFTPDEGQVDPDIEKSSSRKLPLKKVLLIAGLMTAAFLGIRHFGWMQPSELVAFDQMMRLRPAEKLDDRLLVVEITEEDLQLQTDRGMFRQGSLSDQALSKLLTNIGAHQPSAIGVDVYHDFPIASTSNTLKQQLKQISNLYMICRHIDPQVHFPGIAPIPGLSPDKVGFSDVVEDLDGVLRRQFFYLNANRDSPCPTELSFSLQLALRYFEQAGISAQPKFDIQQGTVTVSLGDRLLPLIRPHWGGYQGMGDWYQIMLNYRSAPAGRRVTLEQVLNNDLEASWVKGKVVLVGVTAPSVKDALFTPHSWTRTIDQKTPGVWVQAQMVSQMISAVVDDRPLLTVWVLWQEVAWVMGWAVLAGIGGWMVRSSPFWVRCLFFMFICLGLWTICFITLLFFGLWVPLIPAGCAILGSISLLIRRDNNDLSIGPI